MCCRGRPSLLFMRQKPEQPSVEDSIHQDVWMWEKGRQRVTLGRESPLVITDSQRFTKRYFKALMSLLTVTLLSQNYRSLHQKEKWQWYRITAEICWDIGGNIHFHPVCTVVASNEHFIRKESQKGDKTFSVSTVFEWYVETKASWSFSQWDFWPCLVLFSYLIC